MKKTLSLFTKCLVHFPPKGAFRASVISLVFNFNGNNSTLDAYMPSKNINV